MTPQKYSEWLSNPTSVYVFLIEAQALIGGTETTMYLSTEDYNTSPTDTIPNVSYKPIASLGSLFTEQLSLTNGDASISQGQLLLSNIDGSIDGWMQYVWANRPINVYVGDARWPRGDFQRIFTGYVAGIKPVSRTQFNLLMRDKLQQLNTTLTEVKLGGTTQNKDSIIPVPLGQLHNITPLQEDPAQLTFRVGQTQFKSVIEVRDNGVPLTGTSAPIIDLAHGRIQLVANPAGTITCSIEGDAPGGVYAVTCASLIQYVVTNYGNAATRFTSADIDTANFAAFDQANQQIMGDYITDTSNVLNVCRDFASSLGAQISISVTTGLLRIIQLGAPYSSSPRQVTPSCYEERSLEPTDSPDVVAAVKLGFCKNWTVQDQATLPGIPQEHKDLFAEEWLTSTNVDATVQANYKLTGDPAQQDSMLLRRIDADAETQRRVNFWKVPRIVYYFNGLPQLFTLELGDTIQVFHPTRYGMQNGTLGTVISLARDWKARRVKVGFIV